MFQIVNPVNNKVKPVRSNTCYSGSFRRPTLIDAIGWTHFWPDPIEYWHNVLLASLVKLGKILKMRAGRNAGRKIQFYPSSGCYTVSARQPVNRFYLELGFYCAVSTTPGEICFRLSTLKFSGPINLRDLGFDSFIGLEGFSTDSLTGRSLPSLRPVSLLKPILSRCFPALLCYIFLMDHLLFVVDRQCNVYSEYIYFKTHAFQF